MDKTPSKDNKERQHSKVRRHMGPRERDGRGCMAAGWLVSAGRGALASPHLSTCFTAPCTALESVQT